LKKKREIKSSINKKINLNQINNNNAKKISSIPSKKNCYGFDINDEGKILNSDDPLKFLKYTGEKIDSVGPGAYELIDKSNWERKGTAWSRFKTKRKFMGEEVKETKKISKSVNNSFENYNKDGINPIEKRKTEKEQLRKYIKVKSAFRKQMVEVFQKENHEELGIIHKNATPGPGYYNSSKGFEVSNKYRFIPQENYQFFGSLSERFGQQIGINEDIIGPGTYFNSIKTNLNNKNSKKTKNPIWGKNNEIYSISKN